jgi:hypothetical protein
MTSFDRISKARANFARQAARFAFVSMAAAIVPLPAHAACEFAPVKQAIDTVLDKDADKGKTFRSEVKSGADSIAALEALVSPDMQKQIDICRFEVAEYLTKRGFPPFH